MATPIQPGQRLGSLDMLRGWALLGVVIVNYSQFVGTAKGDFPNLDFASTLLSTVLFLGKSWMLLSFLFGYGFGYLMDKFGTGAAGDRFFLWRMFMLLLISVFNILIFPGDILHDYALIGILLLPLNRLGSRALYVIGFGLFLSLVPMTIWLDLTHRTLGSTKEADYWIDYLGKDPVSWVKGNVKFFWNLDFNFKYGVVVHVVMLAMMTLGLASRKAGFLPRLLSDKPFRKRCFWWALAATLLTIGLLSLGASTFPKSNFGWAGTYFFFGTMGFFFFMALIRIYVTGRGAGFFKGLATVGRMTLTNYLVQNLLTVVLFSGLGFGWAQRPDDWEYLAIALAVFIAQMIFSRWWLSRYRYGPVEWLWRCLSYGQWFKLRISDDE